MYSKYIFIAAVIATLFAVQNAETAPNNLIIGSREIGDRLVVIENVIEKYKPFQTIEVNKTFSTPRAETITQVKLLDLGTNGNGAVPEVLQGGPGYHYVIVKFRSRWSRSINFHVEVYGR